MFRRGMARNALLLGILLALVPNHAWGKTALHVRPVRPSSDRGRAAMLPLARARAVVDFYAQHHKVPLRIARNLVTVESAWKQTAVSPVGARGLTQLMPGTARDLRVNIHDSVQNVEGGMRYLARMYERFGRWDLALAAYNTGPARVATYGGVPPWTRRYVSRIMGKPLPGSVPKPAPLLARRPDPWTLRALLEAMVEFPAGVRRSKMS